MWAPKNHTETAWALLHPPTLPWPWLLRLVLGLHAAIDALHTVAVLFPLWVPRWARGASNTYFSLFMDAWLDGEESTPMAEAHQLLMRRALCYWVAAMSLPRALACARPAADLYAVVSCMYVLEALALMYELGQRTVVRSQARMAVFISLGMALAVYSLPPL